MRHWHITLLLLSVAIATAAVAVACSGGGKGSTNGTPAAASEKPGTTVQVLAVSNCNRSWVRPEQVTATYRSMLTGKVSLYAAYVPSDTSDTYDGGFGSQYVVVFSVGGGSSGVALHVKDGRVTWIEHACPDLAGLVASSRVKSFIVGLGSTPATSATPGGSGATGIPELDHLIQSATAGNDIELASLAGYQRVACAAKASATAPACR